MNASPIKARRMNATTAMDAREKTRCAENRKND